MSEKTLYLVQSSFANTENVLNKLTQIYSEQDSIVLMGDAALAIHAQQLQGMAKVYLLENDTQLLASTLNHAFKSINYSEFSDLVLSYTRCISLK